MFLGTIPFGCRSVMKETVRSWNVDEVWVACSGNFTIERALDPIGVRCHSNDVSVYSCAMGWYLADKPVDVEIRSESKHLWWFAEDHMETDVDRLATLMLATQFADSVGAHNKFHERTMRGVETQFERMHADTVKKLAALQISVESFSAMDAIEYVHGVVPADGPVVSFPPFDTGGYEKMWEAIDRHFVWPTPEYPVMDEELRADLLEAIADREHWCVGTDHHPDGWEDRYVAEVITTARARPMYVYASSGHKRIVMPRQDTQPVLTTRVPDDGDDLPFNEIKLAWLSVGQFAALRAQYLDPQIAPASPDYAFAVLLDGHLAGSFAYSRADPGMHGPGVAYLLSDFATTGVERMSQLIVAAALSEETRQLLQRQLNCRMLSMSTTAFSQNHESMKYRSVIGKCTTRKDGPPGYRFQLNYDADFGGTLQEALDSWKERNR